MRLFLTVLLSGSAFVPAASAGFLDFFFPKRDVQVITVTDTTPVGALRRPASATHPVYYAAVSAGYRELGGIIAGEKVPPSQEVIKTITNVLAKQGYLPGSAAHPPALLLIWTWGTMNTDRLYIASSDDFEGQQVNRGQMLRFMGAYKLGMIPKVPDPFRQDLLLPGLIAVDADATMINDAATDDLYIAAIGAYDYGAAMRQEKALLWTTKISCPSRGLGLPETLPVMLAIAGPYIGRETAKPVSINASDKFKPEVKIGDPTLVEFIDSDQLPVIEVGAPDAKKKAPATPKQKKR